MMTVVSQSGTYFKHKHKHGVLGLEQEIVEARRELIDNFSYFSIKRTEEKK